MVKILTPRNISIELRSRIAKCYIWSTLLYGAETWTLTKVTSDKLEAFETVAIQENVENIIKIAHSEMLYLVNTFICSRNMDTN